MLAALGQRDTQHGGSHFGVLEEQLIEIAHPEEQETSRIGLLQDQELGHDGSRAGGAILPRCIAVMVEVIHNAFHSRNRPNRYKGRIRKA